MRHGDTAPRNLLIATAAAFSLLTTPVPAAALSTGAFSMEILIAGSPSREYPARGTTYVEAQRGSEYAIRLTNRTARRIAIALSVDGLNTIDAETSSASDAAKWVLGPRESVVISGWQTSSETARKFYFTTEERSYGAWLDRSANLGIIEAVVFRERPRRLVHCPDPVPAEPGRAGESAAPRSESSAKSRELSDDYAATGIGGEVGHQVRTVRLDLEPEPAAKLRVRYEYRPQLVALGVLPPPEAPETLDRREAARGFTDSRFCPDPFGERRR